jgi:type I restriction enzyme S subunit
MEIGSVSSAVDRAEVPGAGITYRQLGVRLWGQGAYEREAIDGAATRYGTLNRVKAGDIVVNKIWARNGSVSVVPAELDGAYVSSEFPLFEPHLDKLEPRWFYWITKAQWFWERCDEKARGTSGKNRIRPKQFAAIKIPLPPLEEQRRIVARIERLAGKIEEARGLREGATSLLGRFWPSILRRCFDVGVYSEASLASVCDAIIDNLHSTPVYDGNDYPCIRSQDIGWGTMSFDTALRTSEAEFLARVGRGEPQRGDIVFVREGDIGRCAVVDGTRRFCLGQRVMMLRPNPRIVESRFLMYQLMSPPMLSDQVLTGKTGTTSHHVNIKHLKRVRLCVPSLPEQRRIVAYLDGLQAKVDQLKALQAQSAAELEALLPAVLEKAFRGEL